MRGRDYFDPFDEFMRTFLESRRGMGRGREGKAWYPGIDVYEIETGIIIVAELPGVKKDNVDVTVNGNLLTIRGKRFEPVYNFVRCHHREILYGDFERSIKLPGEFDVEGIKAELKEGFLLLFLPLKKSSAKKITIE
ncbi:MAG: Hsp20/alpha crystallin family protein [Deltaproteobacteria bacterium]|nr:MAG: Hsp20/alpha crystallin family protein [Deltaproteobacteria bacterium]